MLDARQRSYECSDIYVSHQKKHLSLLLARETSNIKSMVNVTWLLIHIYDRRMKHPRIWTIGRDSHSTLCWSVCLVDTSIVESILCREDHIAKTCCMELPYVARFMPHRACAAVRLCWISHNKNDLTDISFLLRS